MALISAKSEMKRLKHFLAEMREINRALDKALICVGDPRRKGEEMNALEEARDGMNRLLKEESK